MKRLWLLFAIPLLASPAWLKLATPHFDLYTSAGREKGRMAIARLEQIRQVFLEAGGTKRAPLPVRVFLFGSEREFQDFRKSPSTQGFYQGGPERDYIAALDSANMYRVIQHEYVHLVLNHSTSPLPKWLEEGTAEFYSTLEPGKDRLLIGGVIPGHVATLRSGQWLKADELNRVDQDSQYYNEASRAGLFYAQSWAMAHMMNLAPGYRTRLPHFVQLVDDAAPVEFAFLQAFGRTIEQAIDEARLYVRNGTFGIAQVGWNPQQDQDAEIEPAIETHLQLALMELLLQLGNYAAAEKKLSGLQRALPDSGEVETAAAMYHLGRKEDEEALRRLRRAVTLPDAPANAFFELAMLVRDRGGSPAEVDANLHQAAGRNPAHAEAHFLIGLRASQAGRHEEAIGWYERAVAVLPRQSPFWHALAMAYHHTGRQDQARRAARKAADAAARLHELEMAHAAIRLTAQTAAAPKPVAERPAVTVPDSWRMPEGDARLEGVLEHIDCRGSAARFQVRAGSQPVWLWVEKPGEVLLKTASSLTFTFACGAQRPRKVAVEYKQKPDAARGTAGDITAIEFP